MEKKKIQSTYSVSELQDVEFISLKIKKNVNPKFTFEHKINLKKFNTINSLKKYYQDNGERDSYFTKGVDSNVFTISTSEELFKNYDIAYCDDLLGLIVSAKVIEALGPIKGMNAIPFAYSNEIGYVVYSDNKINVKHFNHISYRLWDLRVQGFYNLPKFYRSDFEDMNGIDTLDAKLDTNKMVIRQSYPTPTFVSNSIFKILHANFPNDLDLKRSGVVKFKNE